MIQTESFVQKPSTKQCVTATIDSTASLKKFRENVESKEFKESQKMFYEQLTCEIKEAYAQLMNELIGSIETTVHSALHTVISLSLYDTTRLLHVFAHDVRSYSGLLQYCCFFLNPNNIGYLKAFWQIRSNPWLKAKREILKEFLESESKVKSCDSKQLLFLTACSYHLGCVQLRKQLERLQKLNSCELSNEDDQRVFSKARKLEIDGSIYDRARDPPGQRSVYIPPGDPCKETYRLSTFMKFPENSPVSPRDLATAGFFYSGYKDRVKCFCCALCVENWEFGDDVKASRWHKENCQMMKGEECDNIPIGGLHTRSKITSMPPASSFTSAVVGKSPQQPACNSLQRNIVPAGELLTQLNGVGSHVTRQTAKPVTSAQRHRPTENSQLATITSSHHEQLIRNLELWKESDRMKTYRLWQTSSQVVHPHALAKSGFFYLGNLDRVQCFSCGGVLRNWSFGDVVDVEHRQHFPDCRLVRGLETRNVPLPPEQRARLPTNVMQEPPDPPHAQQRELQSMFPCNYPVSPHMRNTQARVETFDHRWPATRIQASPQQISKAGFFFLGERDRVKCWYCNGGLQNWDPTDEPWTEHAKWFPTCEFLLQKKGPDFVHGVVARFPNLPRPVLRSPYDVAPSGGPRHILRGRQRPPSPPPLLIDPQIELQRRTEQLEKEMKSHVVLMALEMGFSERELRKVIKKKLAQGVGMYTAVFDLVEDLTNRTSSENEDESDPENETSQQTNAKHSGEVARCSGGRPMTSQLVEGKPGATSRHEDAPMEVVETLVPAGTSSSMEARIKELQDERKCKICLDRSADVVFVPCGHLCSCTVCAQALRKCPICRVKINKAIKAYMS